MTYPISLLRFQMPLHGTWQQYEAYCPRERILIELRVWLDGQPDCSALRLDRGIRGDLIDMQCTISVDRNGCKQEYLAWIWLEYTSNSATDYQVLGYSRVRRVCPSGTVYDASAQAQELAGKESYELEKFLDGCRRPREVPRD